ncbi:uncharacterized protein TNCV_3358021 [Trichonephila clavipes]|nr:uncharacterized protein TNCV_3358021 [Trichonephila clavipes]
MRCLSEVPRCVKCRIQVVPVPACGINDDLFACMYECRFPEFQVSEFLSFSVLSSTNLKFRLVLCVLVHHGVSVKRKKDVLLEIAKELGLEVDITLPKMEFKKRICQSKYYNEEVAKCLLEGNLEEKREIKKFEERRLAREFQLERLRAKLRNKLNENELKAGNRINNLANVFYLSENRSAEVSELVRSVRAVAMCAQRAINPDDIGVGFLELIGDKGVANPEGLIWESTCEEKDTIFMLTGGEKQVSVDRESFRNHTMAKIAGQLNGE